MIRCSGADENKIQLLYYDPDTAPYRFNSIDDINAKQYFYQNGYIVIKNIFKNEQELEYAEQLLWKYLNSIGWQQNEPSTWNKFPGFDLSGIIYQYGIGQSEFQWFIRTREKILSTFHEIWNLTKHDDLITSYDGIGIYRPWKYKKRWETLDGLYHIDQNVVKKPYFDAIQGLVTLKDENKWSGSTVVIPGSHLYTTTYLADYIKKDDRDYQQIDIDKLYPLFGEPYNLKALFISSVRGDLVLWDSRLIHTNVPSQELWFEHEINNEDNNNQQCIDENIDENVDKNHLLRVVSYICQTPKSKASTDIIQERIKGFENYQTGNHNPHHLNLYSNQVTLSQITDKPQYNSNKQLDIHLIRSLVGYS